MSRIDNILMQMDEARELVISMCGFTEEQLAEMQFTAAYECLEKVLGSDEYGITELPKTSDFWIWWKDQWYRRDRIFLDRLRFDAELQKYVCAPPGSTTPYILHGQIGLQNMYKRFHRVAPDNIYLNSPVMENSFHSVIKSITRH